MLSSSIRHGDKGDGRIGGSGCRGILRTLGVTRRDCRGFCVVRLTVQSRRWAANHECFRVARQKGGTMRAMPLPECLGTVVIHRHDAVSCTRDTCPRDLPLESWFRHHASFITCSSDDCPYCRFNDPVPATRWDRHAGSSVISPGRRRGRLLELAFRRHV